MLKLDGKTKDLISENISKLRELFPEAFKEGKIDFDALRQVLGDEIDSSNERYSFTWHGKSDAIKLALKQSTGTLRPCKEESKDWETTKNIFIEGDNLEVLRILQASYRNKIKMIYIDPPYNTGNDFIYEDDFKDPIKNYKEKIGEVGKANPETAGRYHTNWLNMMYPRLRLARNLLKEEGVIFISIDDNEVHNLRKICDEIFGEENYVSDFVIVRSEGGGLAKQVVRGHDYLLAFAKNISCFKPIKRPKDIRGKIVTKDEEEYWIEEDWLRKEFGKYGTCHYEEIIEFKGQEKKIEIDEGIKNGLYTLLPKGNGMHIVGRYRLIKEDGSKFYSILKHLNKKGVHDLEELQLSDYFDYPKPMPLIFDLVKGATFASCNDNDILLDFFAGSGTTAHAVMKLNAEDSGNRRCISVQIPEKVDESSEAFKFCVSNKLPPRLTEITKERIRRAGEKIKAEKQTNQGDLFNQDSSNQLDIGFKVFKLDETNFTQWDEESSNIESDLYKYTQSLKPNRTQEDALYEILLKYGIDLALPITELEIQGKKVFSLAANYLLICLEKDLTLSIIEEIAKLNPERVVFYDDGFKDDVVKLNAGETLKKFGVKDIRVI